MLQNNTRKAGFVAIVGKPNAGKSTLMNAIIGSKLSIITPKPQTTRKKVLGIYTENNNQIVFLDTPGLLKPRYEMQKSMMEYVDSALTSSDVIVVILDIQKINLSNPIFPNIILESIEKVKIPKILILNKVDLIADKKQILPVMYAFHALKLFDDIIPLSASENDNIDALIEILVKFIPENEFYYDEDLLSTQPQKFFVSEIIRENIFMEFEEEIPYSTEVYIVEFKEHKGGKWYISAEIIVERDTQKAIIIGKKGTKLREVGEKSRIAIEEHLEREIYLELFVKVRHKWRNNKSNLKFYGY